MTSLRPHSHRFARAGRALTLAVLATVPLIVAWPAQAQVIERRRPSVADERPARTTVGGWVTWAQPQRDFRNYVSGAVGLGGELVQALSRSGAVALRIEGGYLIYGSTTRRQPLGGGALGLVSVDVTTSNNIVFGGLGLQLTSPDGPVRPYVNGTVGFSYFFTESSVEGTSNFEPFASTNNFDDGGFTTMLGGGVYIPLARTKEGRSVSLDIGVVAHANNDVQYLTKNSITVENTASTPVVTPVRSAADFLTFRIGVTVGVR
jgi:hypothetical protein